MIKLNLLPLAEKDWLAQEQIQRWVIFYGCSILSILLIFAVMLGVMWLDLNIQLRGAVNNFNSAQAGLQGQDLKAQQKLITDLNSYLARVDQIQNGQKFYSHLLISLTSLIPSGAQLNSLTINEKNQVEISGLANQREQVIALKDALEKSNLFKNIESPLSNFVEQTNINFYFKFDLQTTALKP